MNATTEHIRPLLQSMLVADHYYQDRATGKHVLAGIFNRMYVGEIEHQKSDSGETVLMPQPGGFRSGSPFAFLSLTEIYGHQDLSLRYSQFDSEKVLFEIRFGITAGSPLEVAEVAFPLPPLPGMIGHFELAAIWRNEVLGSYRINVLPMEKMNTPKGEN